MSDSTKAFLILVVTSVCVLVGVMAMWFFADVVIR